MARQTTRKQQREQPKYKCRHCQHSMIGTRLAQTGNRSCADVRSTRKGNSVSSCQTHNANTF